MSRCEKILLVIGAVGMLLMVCAFVAAVSAQPPQPGDVPAPVVDVFESGLLTAEITCPGSVRAGAVLTLDVSGTSDGTTRLHIAPDVPAAAIQYDSGGDLIYAWIARPGAYAAWWTVAVGRDVATTEVRFEVTAAGDEPPDDDPPPEDTVFLEFVRAAVEDVEAANHREVAATFRTLADRIDNGELRTSGPIQTATQAALFGPIQKLNPQWVAFYNVVFRHMLDDLHLGLPAQWARAFRTIAKGVSP